MLEQVMELVVQLAASDVGEDVLKLLCGNACQLLDGLLAEGVSPEDCADAYRLAAAWLAMDWMKSGQNWDGITSLSAGDLKVTRERGGQSDSLRDKAMELMSPWLRDPGFVFRGVRG